MINADGTNDRALATSTQTSNYAPAWSPDGSQIAFVGDRSSGGVLFVMQADGSEVRELAKSSFTAGDFAWAPDGTKIIFSPGYLELDERGFGYASLVSVDVASGRPTTLIPKEGEAYAPAVSPG